MQLTLPLHLSDAAIFDNFFPATNQRIVDYLQRFIKNEVEPYTYLWGHKGVGCSHLLQACCQQVYEQGLRAVYLPLADLIHLSPKLLDELEFSSLICLDDLEAIKGQPLWEEALFHLYNRIQITKNRLLIAAHVVPDDIGLQLPDLVSRLKSGVIFQVHELVDEDKSVALQMRAKLRGLELTHEVIEFLLHRFPRNLTVLFQMLERLDKASLAEQRRLTIPFVKKVLQV